MCSLCGVLLSDHWAEADGGARARIFRVGLLMQGKGVKFADLVRWAVSG